MKPGPIVLAAAVSLAGCDLGEFAFGVGRALTEGEHYAVKDGQVVWVSHPSMGTTPRRVERRVEADPATFRIAAHEMYATDSRAVFCKGRPLAGGDPRGFRLIPGAPDDRTPAATDGATVWLGCDEIAGADGAGFRFLQGPYATDGRAVFRATSRIDGAQPASFRILDLGNDVAVDAGFRPTRRRRSGRWAAAIRRTGARCSGVSSWPRARIPRRSASGTARCSGATPPAAGTARGRSPV